MRLCVCLHVCGCAHEPVCEALSLSLRLSVCSGYVNLCDCTRMCVCVCGCACMMTANVIPRVCTYVTPSRQLWRCIYKLGASLPLCASAGQLVQMCVRACMTHLE